VPEPSGDAAAAVTRGAGDRVIVFAVERYARCRDGDTVRTGENRGAHVDVSKPRGALHDDLRVQPSRPRAPDRPMKKRSCASVFPLGQAWCNPGNKARPYSTSGQGDGLPENCWRCWRQPRCRSRSPKAAGAKVTFKVADCPGVRTVPADTLLELKPVPEALTPEMVTFETTRVLKRTAPSMLVARLCPHFEAQSRRTHASKEEKH